MNKIMIDHHPETQQLSRRLPPAPITLTDDAFLEIVIRQTVNELSNPYAEPPCHSLIGTFKALKHYYGIDTDTENHCFQALLLFSADLKVPLSIRIKRLSKYLKLSDKSGSQHGHQLDVTKSIALDNTRLTPVSRPSLYHTTSSHIAAGRKTISGKTDTLQSLSYIKKSPQDKAWSSPDVIRDNYEEGRDLSVILNTYDSDASFTNKLRALSMHSSELSSSRHGSDHVDSRSSVNATSEADQVFFTPQRAHDHDHHRTYDDQDSDIRFTMSALGDYDRARSPHSLHMHLDTPALTPSSPPSHRSRVHFDTPLQPSTTPSTTPQQHHSMESLRLVSRRPHASKQHSIPDMRAVNHWQARRYRQGFYQFRLYSQRRMGNLRFQPAPGSGKSSPSRVVTRKGRGSFAIEFADSCGDQERRDVLEKSPVISRMQRLRMSYGLTSGYNPNYTAEIMAGGSRLDPIPTAASMKTLVLLQRFLARGSSERQHLMHGEGKRHPSPVLLVHLDNLQGDVYQRVTGQEKWLRERILAFVIMHTLDLCFRLWSSQTALMTQAKCHFNRYCVLRGFDSFQGFALARGMQRLGLNGTTKLDHKLNRHRAALCLKKWRVKVERSGKFLTYAGRADDRFKKAKVGVYFGRWRSWLVREVVGRDDWVASATHLTHLCACFTRLRNRTILFKKAAFVRKKTENTFVERLFFFWLRNSVVLSKRDFKESTIRSYSRTMSRMSLGEGEEEVGGEAWEGSGGGDSSETSPIRRSSFKQTLASTPEHSSPTPVTDFSKLFMNDSNGDELRSPSTPASRRASRRQSVASELSMSGGAGGGRSRNTSFEDTPSPLAMRSRRSSASGDFSEGYGNRSRRGSFDETSPHGGLSLSQMHPRMRSKSAGDFFEANGSRRASFESALQGGDKDNTNSPDEQMASPELRSSMRRNSLAHTEGNRPRRASFAVDTDSPDGSALSHSTQRQSTSHSCTHSMDSTSRRASFQQSAGNFTFGTFDSSPPSADEIKSSRNNDGAEAGSGKSSFSPTPAPLLRRSSFRQQSSIPEENAARRNASDDSVESCSLTNNVVDFSKNKSTDEGGRDDDATNSIGDGQASSPSSAPLSRRASLRQSSHSSSRQSSFQQSAANEMFGTLDDSWNSPPASSNEMPSTSRSKFLDVADEPGAGYDVSGVVNLNGEATRAPRLSLPGSWGQRSDGGRGDEAAGRRRCLSVNDLLAIDVDSSIGSFSSPRNVQGMGRRHSLVLKQHVNSLLSPVERDEVYVYSGKNYIKEMITSWYRTSCISDNDRLTVTFTKWKVHVTRIINLENSVCAIGDLRYKVYQFQKFKQIIYNRAAVMDALDLADTHRNGIEKDFDFGQMSLIEQFNEAVPNWSFAGVSVLMKRWMNFTCKQRDLCDLLSTKPGTHRYFGVADDAGVALGGNGGVSDAMLFRLNTLRGGDGYSVHQVDIRLLSGMKRYKTWLHACRTFRFLIDKGEYHWKAKYAGQFFTTLRNRVQINMRHDAVLLKRTKKFLFMWKVSKVAHRRRIMAISKPFHVFRVLSRVRQFFGTWFETNLVPVLRLAFMKIHSYTIHCAKSFDMVQKLRDDRLARYVLHTAQQVHRDHAWYRQQSVRRAYTKLFIRPVLAAKRQRRFVCQRQFIRWNERRSDVAVQRQAVNSSRVVHDRKVLRRCFKGMGLLVVTRAYQRECIHKASAAADLIQLLQTIQKWKMFVSRSREQNPNQVNYFAIMSLWRLLRRIKQIESQRLLVELGGNFNDESKCKKCLALWHRWAKKRQRSRDKLRLSRTFYRQKNQSFVLKILSSMSQA